MRNGLYSSYADTYAAIADDRPFLEELSVIGALSLRSCDTFVELFAGPGYHSTTLQQAGFSGQIVAIDNSPNMKEVARGRGFSGDFICSDVLEALQRLEEASLVLIPRYCLSLVSRKEAIEIFRHVRRMIEPTGGSLFVEIHAEDFIDACLDGSSRWSSIGSYSRAAVTSSGEAECVWPYAVKLLDEEQGTVEMEVRVIFAHARERHLTFRSIEHLHRKASVLGMAKTALLEEDAARRIIRPDSILMSFKSAQET